MVEAARRELRRRGYNDSGRALCGSVSFGSLRSSRNENELQGSKFGGERALACSLDLSRAEAACRERLRRRNNDSGLALCKMIRLFYCGQAAI